MLNCKKTTPLHKACHRGNIDTVKYLIEHEANVNALDDDKDTPLHWACCEGYVDIVKYLIENGADLNAVNYDEDTPISIAYSKPSPAAIMVVEVMSPSRIHRSISVFTFGSTGFISLFAVTTVASL